VIEQVKLLTAPIANPLDRSWRGIKTKFLAVLSTTRAISSSLAQRTTLAAFGRQRPPPHR